MKTNNTSTIVDQISMQAVVVAARMCEDAILTDDQVLCYRGNERLKAAVAAACKGHPDHSRVFRTATELLQKWREFCTEHRLFPGMADPGTEENPISIRLMREHKDMTISKEFLAFSRAVERFKS